MIRTIPLLLALSTAANAAGSLQRNPFTVPIELEEGAPPVAQIEPQRQALDLRATLVVAGGRSAANLGGSILMVGEEFAGYRLVSVSEGEAVLEREGETIRVFVGEDEEQTDGLNEQ